MKKVLLMFSGDTASTVLLYSLIQQGHAVTCFHLVIPGQENPTLASEHLAEFNGIDGIKTKLDWFVATMSSQINLGFDYVALGLCVNNAINNGFLKYYNRAMTRLPHIQVKAPFLKEPFVELVRLGGHLKVDFTRVWDCRLTESKPCGKCKGCRERAYAFKLNHWLDPQIKEGWKHEMNKGASS